LEIPTPIADAIQAADTKARYDNACKRLLSNKRVLAWILKECVEEYRDIPVEKIAEKYIEGTPEISTIPVAPDTSHIAHTGVEDATITEGSITYDIRFNAIAPSGDGMICLIINVEAQYKFNPGYPLPKRGIYYGSRMISAQHGTVFTESHYEKIQKVYSIWICINAPKTHQNSITRYRITEENLVGNVHENPANYDLLTLIMIGLGNSDDNQYKGILRLLRVLLSSQVEVTDKKQILEEEFQIPMSQELEGDVSLVCNLGEGVFQEGFERGEAAGMTKGKLDSIRNVMKNLGCTVEKAMAAVGIPEADRATYLEKLKS